MADADADVDSEDDFTEEVTAGDAAMAPSEISDPTWLVDSKIPQDIRDRYEVYSYRSAAVILAEGHAELFAELCDALRRFEISRKTIRTAGGNESDIPKLLSSYLRPLNWNETVIQGDLLVRLISKEQVGVSRNGKPKYEKAVRELQREKYLDGHKVDYVKGRVAFDLEWNSKDQTFDRDLYAFSAFAQCGVVDVGVLVTRGFSMTPFIKGLGPSLSKGGVPEVDKKGVMRQTSSKYGASTTWMGKLLYRLNAGRNGACPVLAIGITPACVVD
ncbi:BglII/BstYI family type II restriction endonuclease [Caulobacter sp. KR2-114]|uniref:BglII/BstYI family type II restriction endonuclease n=1 Tax=Caulobacter sp. KR2-114 TaxID=3400912 RepID=UPI003C08D5F2